MQGEFYPRPATLRDQAPAEINLCRTVLSLKAFQAAHGYYSDTLDQLGPPLLPDPLGGKLFVYRREGQGFLLYSIGPDLRDDGGRSQYDAKGGYHESGDIVWRCER